MREELCATEGGGVWPRPRKWRDQTSHTALMKWVISVDNFDPPHKM